MASLQCSKCGEGIHFNSLPKDIEYIYFPKNVWKSVCNTKFDKNNKIMDEFGIYPKLFRSSTIENDFWGQFVKFWKCPECGTLHLLSNDRSVKKVFIKTDQVSIEDFSDEGIMFNDYLWDEITEKDMSNDQLSLVEPSLYVRLNNTEITVSKTADFSVKDYYRLYEPDWMNC